MEFLLELFHGGFYAAVGTTIAVILVEATGYSAFYFFGTCGMAFWGWTLRSELSRTSDGPLAWAVPYSVWHLVQRWPMLIFDIWTLGISGLVGFLMLVAAYS